MGGQFGRVGDVRRIFAQRANCVYSALEPANWQRENKRTAGWYTLKLSGFSSSLPVFVSV